MELGTLTPSLDGDKWSALLHRNFTLGKEQPMPMVND
jgi:hypothetical protein